MTYAAFLESKRRVIVGSGLTPVAPFPSSLYDWQSAIVKWALRKGKGALFCDCGLGKTPMQLTWADALWQALKVRTLILAPLAVAEQTVREGAKFGIPVLYAIDHAHISDAPIVITNYERLDKFDVSAFGAVVLDESSILKAFDGKTRTKLIETFKDTPLRLCCTATPAPNDIAELANHAEFLGLMTRSEFLATWFVHDDMGWRMKKHAVQPFYRWLASWAIAIRRPSDLGYSDEGFILPELRIHDRLVPSEGTPGSLFPELSIKGIHGRLSARRGSLEARVDAVCNLVHERGVPWLIWCGLNEESTAITAEMPGAVEVTGADSYAEKVGAVVNFCDRKINKLVSKVRILGYGLNFQHCSHMAFVGLGDSYEQYYQAIRRCWRFGQKKPVDVYVVTSEAEQIVVENVRRKEATADTLSRELVAHMRDFEREEVSA